MAIRTYTYLGQAYGTTPATVTVIVDGNTVYSGAVTTTDAPIPAWDQRSTISNEMFSWTDDETFFGAKSISIAVTGSDLLLSSIEAVAETANTVVRLGTDGEIDGDPMVNVTIDGVSQNPDRGDLTGIWCWVIPAGGTLTADFTVSEPKPITPL